MVLENVIELVVLVFIIFGSVGVSYWLGYIHGRDGVHEVED